MIPRWTLGDRLRKALEQSSVSIDEMAEQLGVTDRTVRNYMNDATPVRRVMITEWARVTGVPIEWLLTGAGTSNDPAHPATPPSQTRRVGDQGQRVIGDPVEPKTLREPAADVTGKGLPFRNRWDSPRVHRMRPEDGTAVAA